MSFAMQKEIKLENFQGPLDLLVQLIDTQEMAITAISIAAVTEQFLAYLDDVEEKNPEELADFLVVATKLLLLKSQTLLPYLQIEAEEDPRELETQLKMYRKYAQAAGQIEAMIAQRNFLYEKKVTNIMPAGFHPPVKIAAAHLRAAFKDILQWLEPVVKIPKKAVEKVITLREKFCQIQKMLETKIKSSFYEFINDRGDKTEIVVTFLAILELVKQQSLCARQEKPFAEITIEKRAD